ncbi:MAG: hypothetical protein JXR81_07440 [Candidatus Goldbacteria bacterium]|nr:hypothetical protein [Candidatus Goldiibacteriota bacterium]
MKRYVTITFIFLIILLFFQQKIAFCGRCLGDFESYVQELENIAIMDYKEDIKGYVDYCIYNGDLLYIQMGNRWAKEENEQIFNDYIKSEYRPRIIAACNKIFLQKNDDFKDLCVCLFAKYRVTKVNGKDLFPMLVNKDKSPIIDPIKAAMLKDKRATKLLIESFYTNKLYDYDVRTDKKKYRVPIAYFAHEEYRNSILNALWFLNDTRSIRFLEYVIDNDPSDDVIYNAEYVLRKIREKNAEYVYNEVFQFMFKGNPLKSYHRIQEKNISFKDLKEILIEDDNYIKVQSMKIIVNRGNIDEINEILPYITYLSLNANDEYLMRNSKKLLVKANSILRNK